MHNKALKSESVGTQRCGTLRYYVPRVFTLQFSVKRILSKAIIENTTNKWPNLTAV